MRKVTGSELERVLRQLVIAQTDFFGVNSACDNVARQRALLESAGLRTFRVDHERPSNPAALGLIGLRIESANEHLATIQVLCAASNSERSALLLFAIQLLSSAMGLRCFLTPARDDGWARDLCSIGFTRLGVLRDHEYAAGSYRDVPLLAYENEPHAAR